MISFGLPYSNFVFFAVVFFLVVVVAVFLRFKVESILPRKRLNR